MSNHRNKRDCCFYSPSFSTGKAGVSCTGETGTCETEAAAAGRTGDKGWDQLSLGGFSALTACWEKNGLLSWPEGKDMNFWILGWKAWNCAHVLYMRFVRSWWIVGQEFSLPGRVAEEGVALLARLLSFCMNSSLGLMERWEMIDAASWKKVEYAIFYVFSFLLWPFLLALQHTTDENTRTPEVKSHLFSP